MTNIFEEGKELFVTGGKWVRQESYWKCNQSGGSQCQIMQPILRNVEFF